MYFYSYYCTVAADTSVAEFILFDCFLCIHNWLFYLSITTVLRSHCYSYSCSASQNSTTFATATLCRFLPFPPLLSSHKHTRRCQFLSLLPFLFSRCTLVRWPLRFDTSTTSTRTSIEIDVARVSLVRRADMSLKLLTPIAQACAHHRLQR